MKKLLILAALLTAAPASAGNGEGWANGAWANGWCRLPTFIRKPILGVEC